MQLLILDDIFRSLTKVVLSCAFHHLQLLQRVTCTILRHRPLLYVDGDYHCQEEPLLVLFVRIQLASNCQRRGREYEM